LRKKKTHLILFGLILTLILAVSCSSGGNDSNGENGGTTTDPGNGGQTSTDTWVKEFRDLDSENFTIVPPKRVRETTDGHYVVTAAETTETDGKTNSEKTLTATGYIYRTATDGLTSDRLIFPDVIPKDLQTLENNSFFVCGSKIESGVPFAYVMVCQADGTVVQETSFHDLASLSLSAAVPDGFLVAGVTHEMTLKLFFLGPDLATQWEFELGSAIDPTMAPNTSVDIKQLADLTVAPDGTFLIDVELLFHEAEQTVQGMGLARLSTTGTLQWTRSFKDTGPRDEPWYVPSGIAGRNDGSLLISFWNNDAGTFHTYLNHLDTDGDLIWSWEYVNEGGHTSALTTRSDGVALNLIADYSLGERFCSIAFIGTNGQMLKKSEFGVFSLPPAPDMPRGLSITSDDHIVVTGYHYYYDNDNNYKMGIFMTRLNAGGECPDCN
jgi:hypothetical protein